MDSISPKAKGIIYGLAIGDVHLGWLTEVSKLDQIRVRYGPQGITQLPDPALFTDDTQAPILAGEKTSYDNGCHLR